MDNPNRSRVDPSASLMSNKNPFHHSPSEVVTTPPSPPLPPIPPPSPPSGPSTSSAPPPPAFEERIDDDLPPAYTPAADTSIGEETLEIGPRRPFQPPPQTLPSSRPRHSNRQSSRAQPLIQLSPTNPASSSSFHTRSDPRLGLAPWQNQQQYRQRQIGGGGLLGALIDTVRDIADVVSGAHDERAMIQSAYPTPYAPPQGFQGQYAPPPPRRPASTPPIPPPSTVPDDGSPTRTPVPGHPLLRDGHLLVYPRDYLCFKCNNTGYKNYDPSHPCRKCWEKYAKSYTGALTYTSWSPSGNDPRMQRPLPKFVPPHLASLHPGSSSSSAYASQSNSGPYSRPPQHPNHNRSLSQPHNMRSRDSGPSYYVMHPMGPYDATPPVPHAIPVSPGDPRLGGRLCMRCSGAGVRTIMLIDVMTCDECGGTGRIWM